MYRYEVTLQVKNDIEGVIGRPYFYEDNSKYYVDAPKHEISIQYHDPNVDQFLSKTLDQICLDLYSTDFFQNSTRSEIPKDIENLPFTSKILPNGQKLFKRVHGVSSSVSGNSTENIEFIVPYTQCKVTAVELIGAEIGDSCNFYIYDNALGTISGFPNVRLNQFGFNLYLAKDYYREESSYDADLIQGLKLQVEFTNSSSNQKFIGVNFILHEVV